mmetsp:Transcript_1441/g.1965  ORF Transcript_1441/g.1965 Transcript_1441/m.1965 type:complete len:444 (+) Transcript_1441:96-1427(+)|eukprot:CAMPEP_0198148440 /NCGR_PEP_ID=MMETSP1443-20131203/41423_1 /TAXON_ID=186043 /ORGANISM="Entomoneis sp., Strain CCMP2396" /LENGTH=443 /DNA_ID=CAMNT_0043813125 /DNA_START=88 /DNA_END=1419 /DNA_ORIENTATION=+
MSNEECLERPLKRGKMLPQKRLFQKITQDSSDDDGENHNDCLSFFEGNQDSLNSSMLTPSQQKSRARLLQQRHPPALDLAQLPDDLLFRITGYLDAPSLLQIRCLNRRYRWLGGRDDAGWNDLTAQLWETKVHIPETALLLSYATSVCNDLMLKAYQESILDARERNFIDLKELCYDPTTQRGTVWSFRFKESAGSDWTAMDPWYNGLPCRKLVFLSDGSIKQYIVGSATLEAPRFGTASSLQRVPENNITGPGNHLVVDPPMPMTWRFITRPMDLPTRPVGSYVRITVGGRDVPTYAIRRSPTGNWGFIMESCWGLFASFDLPNKLGSPQDATPRPMRQRRILRRTTQGNVWVDFAAEEDADDDDFGGLLEDDDFVFRRNINAPSREENNNDPMLPLRDDSFMLVSNEVQWREAFLYNVGAHTLPDGAEATDEFDRAWGGGF